MADMDFDAVKLSFRRGDPRPLAQWVMTHDLSLEQKEFVAKAICGEIEKIDGRTVQPVTEIIQKHYVKVRVLNSLLEALDPSAPAKLSDAKVAKVLADKLGYQDVDSVRRALNRYKKRMKDGPDTKMKVLVEKPGHNKK